MTLRAYQVEAIAKVRAAMADGAEPIDPLFIEAERHAIQSRQHDDRRLQHLARRLRFHQARATVKDGGALPDESALLAKVGADVTAKMRPKWRPVAV